MRSPPLRPPLALDRSLDKLHLMLILIYNDLIQRAEEERVRLGRTLPTKGVYPVTTGHHTHLDPFR